MRNIRNCTGSNLDTGVSKCPLDLAHIIGAIVVEPGTNFPTSATASTLEQKCHADRPDRIMPILTFVEYAKEGGEPNVSSVGYGGNHVANIGARTDTFTLDKCYPDLAAALSKCMNKKFEVFYFDENNVVYGLQNGDNLRGFPITRSIRLSRLTRPAATLPRSPCRLPSRTPVTLSKSSTTSSLTST